MKNKFTKILAILGAFFVLKPVQVLACACGCSLFDVGTSSLLPSAQGGLAFIEYDNISQNKNWHGTSSSDASNNELKKIDTQIVTVGGQYMFNRKWGVMARAPYVLRNVKSATSSDEEENDAGTISQKHNSVGDVKVHAIYSGLFDDMSTGLTFGLKLPTGANKQAGFDSDTQIGNGSTDIILGAYHMGYINQGATLGWFSQLSWQKPIITKSDFHPGDEASLSIGSYYSLGRVANFSKVSPMLQIITSKKSSDSGLNADKSNSGYSRAFIAPGVELNFAQFKIYADVELPIYENVRGNQLEVARIFKLILGYKF